MAIVIVIAFGPFARPRIATVLRPKLTGARRMRSGPRLHRIGAGMNVAPGVRA